MTTPLVVVPHGCTHSHRVLSMDRAFLYCSACGASWRVPPSNPQPVTDHIYAMQVAALEQRVAALEARIAALLASKESDQ